MCERLNKSSHFSHDLHLSRTLSVHRYCRSARGKREGSISAKEVSTDGAAHCCLSCHPIRFTICNADMSTERFPFHAKRCVT